MNRGDEADGPPIAKSDPSTPAVSADADLEGAEEAPEPSAPFAVVIFGDGSAAIDGEPVPRVPGEPLDVAILDMLHGYARRRNAPVTGAITDPSAYYVAVVEVAPDGASKLLEQIDGDTDSAELVAEPVEVVEPVVHVQYSESVAAFGDSSPLNETAFPDTGREADAESQGAGPRTTPSDLRPALGKESARKRTQPQSDDEYERPGLLHRPLVVGGVAAGVAVFVIASLVALGTGSSGTEEQNQAAESGNEKSGSPMILELPSESTSAISSPSVSASPSVSPSKPKPKPKPKRSPSASVTTKSVPPKPKETKKTPGDPKMPTGPVVFKNEKWSFCVDLFGQGGGKSGTRIWDDHSCTTSPRDNQLWKLEPVRGNSTDGSSLYLIRNVKDGLCMDLPGEGGVEVSTQIVERECKATERDNQLWWLDKRSNGAYWIRNQKSGDMCMDVSRTSAKPSNARLTVSACGDSAAVQWRIVKG
ncbi:RICIN domain-containing protein [Streptomyces sp. NPDC050535]|uniref:RICIN domain-containing protein n=1 Tax=Streptomyces sp. NPDC050535 TaxID=3365626 RepID=UPI0037998B90